MAGSDPRSLRADAARNREALLRVAREQLASGDGTLKMHVIARRAGVGVGTMYRHFPTREDLLHAVTLDALAHLVEQVRDAVDSTEPGPGVHRVLCLSIRMGRDPALGEVLSACHTPGSATSVLLQQYKDAVTTLLNRARADGQIRSDVSEDDLRRLVGGIQHALLIGDDTAGLTELYSEILLAGLRPAPPTTGRG